MAAYVVIKVALCAEGLTTAIGTHERALLLMDHFMDLQIVAFTKGFVASRKCALEGLLSGVQVDMGLQAVSAAEFFATAVIGALVGLFDLADFPSALLRPLFRFRILRHLLKWRLITNHDLNC